MGKNNIMAFTPPLKILKASAGSGKTFSLTTYFLIFLFSGTKKYREILAVTFTNKATAEMKERVLSVLEGLAKDDHKFQGYQVYIKEAFPELSDFEIQKKAETIFKDILHDYGRFSISTIDKFVQQVVRSFNFELGIEAGYRIEMNLGKVASDLSEILHDTLDKKPELLKWIIDFAKQKIANNERWEYQKALKKIANEIFTEDFQRFEAVIQQDENDTLFPELILQADKNISDFEERLIQDFVKMQDFARKANLENDDFKGKSGNYIGKLKAIKETTIQTTLSFYSKALKYIDNFEEWVHPKSKNPESVESLYNTLNPLLADSYSYYIEHYPNYQLAQLIKGNLYYLRLIREMSTLLGAYRKDNSLLLISDASTLLSKINEGQEDNPSFIWEKVGNRYKHFLFDEFQDTSFGQWNNFLPIVKNALSESSGERTEHLIVGDVKQSIYRWRGGDSRLLLSEIEESLGSFFVENDSLLENYRSSENIIRFNNLIFNSAPKWLQNQVNAMVIENDEVQDYWQKKNYHNIIIRSYQDSHQNSPANVRKGGIIEVNEIPVESNGYRNSQTKQQALQNTADALYQWIEVEKRYKASQIGILVRTGKDAVSIIDYLYKDQKKRDNPHAYQVVSGSALLISNNDAIRLLINALELLRSQPEAARIYKANCIQLYYQLQSQNQEISQVISGEEWMQIKDTPLSGLTDFLPRGFCNNTTELLQLPLSELFEQLISIFNLNTSTINLPYLFSFRDSIAVFTAQGDKGLDAFLEWWYEESDKLFLPAEEGGDVVQVVTIHKSKGLAYDVVMLPLLGWEIGKAGREDNLWVELENTSFRQLMLAPLGFNSTMESSVLSKAYYEERLFRYMDALNEIYVALTRAKHHLFLNLIGQKKELDKSFLASDIIRLALDGKNDIPGLITQGELSDFTYEETLADKKDNSWSFEYYPQSQHLKLQLNKETQKQLDALVQNKRQRLGILSHELLSRADSIEQVDRSLQEMHQEALLKQEEIHEVRNLVIKVLQNNELRHLFSGHHQHLNEQDIIASGGMSYRPDKILLNENEAIIVDFKFTDKIENAHREQIENYKHLLSEMHIPVVKGYLFYGFMDQLILV
jgi:ATP-dependent exoDNAse (exonuclease V) beta subunit